MYYYSNITILLRVLLVPKFSDYYVWNFKVASAGQRLLSNNAAGWVSLVSLCQILC